MDLPTLLSEAVSFFLLVTALTYIISVSWMGAIPRIWPSVFLGKILGRAYQWLVYCPVCTSFWVGLGLGLAGLVPYQEPLTFAGVFYGSLFAVACVHLSKSVLPSFLLLETYEEETKIISFGRKP